MLEDGFEIILNGVWNLCFYFLPCIKRIFWYDFCVFFNISLSWNRSVPFWESHTFLNVSKSQIYKQTMNLVSVIYFSKLIRPQNTNLAFTICAFICLRIYDNLHVFFFIQVDVLRPTLSVHLTNITLWAL